MYRKISSFLVEDVRGKFCKISDGSHLPIIRQTFISESKSNVFRGFHYYAPENAADRLIYVFRGALTDYALDLRADRFGELHQFEFSEGDAAFIPWYMAHGFYTKTGCTLLYNFEVDHIAAYDRAINAASVLDANFLDSCIRSERDINAACLDRKLHSIVIDQ